MEKNFVIDDVRDFNLDHIFDCGQCFRWEKQADGSYTGIAMGRVVNIRTEECAEGQGKHSEAGEGGYSGYASKPVRVTISNCDEEDYRSIWSAYLDMDRDYGAVKQRLAAGSEVMARAIECGRGIRILRQDLWETMVSFIISQNNNIPRIKGCIEKLCALKGEPVGKAEGKTEGEADGKAEGKTHCREFFSLPAPEVMAELTVADLAPCRLGYRAPYLIETARQVMAKGGMTPVEAELQAAASPAEAVELLRQYQGVGPKVASCIALFGLGRLEAFPIDVWVKRVMQRLYGIAESDVKGMTAYAAEHFGDVGGIAQQYLFYYIRGLEG